MAIYTAPINLRFTAATAADSSVWMVRAGATKPLYIRRIVLFSGFDGTAAGTTMRMEIRRFRTATPSGGTVVVPIPKLVASGASSAADCRQETTGAALTVTSVTFDNPLASVGSCSRSVTGGIVAVNLDFVASPIVLDVNDGLTFRNAVAAVIGDSMAGYVEWEE